MTVLSLFFRRTHAIMHKEFLHLLRDHPTLAMIVMLPIIQIMLFGFAINSDPKHLPTVLLIQDESPFVRRFISGLKTTEYFDIKRTMTSEAEATTLLQEGKTQFVIHIPAHFTRDLVRGTRPAILVETDATDPTASANAMASLTPMLKQAFERDLSGVLDEEKGKPDPVEIRVHRLYNPEGFSRYNIVPGLMGIILTMSGVMMTALAMTRERERGNMENLLSMPVHPMEVMIGKLAPYVIIGFVQASLIISLAALLFGVPVIGNLALLACALFIFILCNLALGFTISTTAQNQTQALQLSFLIMMPSILLSGFMFPFWGMPHWAQTLGSIIPATYFIRIVRGILLKGNTLAEIMPHIQPLLVFLVVITLIAMKRYKKTLD